MLDVVAHTCNLSTCKAESGVLQQVCGQPWLYREFKPSLNYIYSETLFWETKNKQKRKKKSKKGKEKSNAKQSKEKTGKILNKEPDNFFHPRRMERPKERKWYFQSPGFIRWKLQRSGALEAATAGHYFLLQPFIPLTAGGPGAPAPPRCAVAVEEDIEVI